MAMPLLLVASYLLGGIPSGYLIARWTKGIDIRAHGSGNPGAANVYRTVGPGAGLATLAADSLKGCIPVLLVQRLRPGDAVFPALCGALAIIGHIWTVFLGLKGGKGVATTAGVFCAIMPAPMLPAVLVFSAALLVSGHISAGSMAAAIVFPFLAFMMKAPWPSLALACGACALILYKHVPNFRRIFREKASELEESKAIR